MSAQTQSAQRLFAILYDKAREDRHRSLGAESSMIWLKNEGWPTLFPGHCFACHMNEHDPCEDHYPLSCPGCVKEEREHQMSVLAAAMRGPIPVEEMKNLFNLDKPDRESD